VLAYPSPRAAAVVLLLVAVGAAGYLWQPALAYARLGALLLVLVAVFDLLLTALALRRRLSLTREFPDVATVALPCPGAHVLANRSRLPLRCQVHEDTLPGIAKEVAGRWRLAGGRTTTRWPLRIVFSRRGEMELGGAGLRVLAGLGLWVLQYRFELGGKVRVYPLIEELAKSDLFAHRRRLYGIGQHQSKKFGRGTEFEQLREYTPDDEFRAINWKATARRGSPVVNQYHVEQARDLMLLIDCGRLMHTLIAGRPRLDRYLDAAVHLGYLALSQRDRVGLLAFDEEVRRFIAPALKARQLDNLVGAVFDLQPRFVESDYALAVTTLKARQPKRGMVVLFTDLVDSISSRSAVANLSRLSRTHLPVIVILDDPAIAGMARQAASEPADAFIKAAAEQFITERQRTMSQLRARGCYIVNVAAEKLNAAVVSQYLEIKARNLL